MLKLKIIIYIVYVLQKEQEANVAIWGCGPVFVTNVPRHANSSFMKNSHFHEQLSYC